MLLIVLIMILVLVCGGVGGYYGYRTWGIGAGFGIAGVTLVILVLLYVFGEMRFSPFGQPIPRGLRQYPSIT